MGRIWPAGRVVDRPVIKNSVGKFNLSRYLQTSWKIRPFSHNHRQDQMFHPRQHDLLCLGPQYSSVQRLAFLRPPQTDFFCISPNRIFGTLEAYFKPKNFFTTMLCKSTTPCLRAQQTDFLEFHQIANLAPKRPILEGKNTIVVSE